MSDASSAAPATAPVVDAAVATPAPTVVATAGTLLSSVPPTPPAPPSDPLAGVAEKFRVYTGEGDEKTLDAQATLLKVNESYSALEKRFGAGDAPPKAAEDYAVSIPETLKEAVDVEALKGSAPFREFLGRLHGASLTQAQADVVIGELLTQSVRLQEAMSVQTIEAAKTDLRQTWPSDADFNAGLQRSARAVEAYAGDAASMVLERYGNDPDFIRMMARIGQEVGEDKGGPVGVVLSQESVEGLMKSKAYWDPKDPGHAAAKRQVDEHFARQYGTAQRGSGLTF